MTNKEIAAQFTIAIIQAAGMPQSATQDPEGIKEAALTAVGLYNACMDALQPPTPIPEFEPDPIQIHPSNDP
jgi:hypothetical protein